MLSSGAKLGPYEILAPIGAGGMGEVYRARDTRLERVVAIKILPQSFASDRERLERFQQEARLLSALNHPNLMAIYDVGEQNGVHFLVSEFLEGQTLRARLEAGALPQRRLNDYALQIARGLAAAHARNIVHRDLKPDNIFVLRDERVKILDFGLAKQAVAAAAADQALTMQDRTAAGMVLGTAGYMSPEQVRGEAVDHRSDVFSFGAILYEMTSGKRAFQGDSGVEVMSAILKQEPPELAESGLNVSPALQRIVQRCLEKKPESRFQSVSDLAFALDALSGSGTSATALRALKSPRNTRFRIGLAAALLSALAIGVIATAVLYRREVVNPAFTAITFRSAYVRHARFAPDARTVVYDARTNGKPSELFSTRTDTAESQSLGIEAGILGVSSTGELAVLLHPRFDFKFTPSGTLARVPLGGGSVRELLDGVLDADWSPDGSALAVSHIVGHYSQLEFPPGKVLYKTDGYISDLRFSPAGDRIAFADHPIFGDDRGFISVIDLSGKRTVLTREFNSIQGVAWPPGGDEVWFTAGTSSDEANSLRAVTLGAKERVLFSAPARLHLHDISKDHNVLLTVEDFRDQTLLVDGAAGQPRDVSAFPFQITSSISRDGRLMLLNSFVTGPTSDYNLYTQRTDGSSPALIGQGGAMALSFDGKWATALDPLHVQQIRIIPTGVGEAQTVNAPNGQKYIGASWMPDGKHLLISAFASGKAPAAYLQNIATGSARPITSEGRFTVTFDAISMNVSPDGKYCIVSDGESHYWRQPLDGGAATDVKGLLEKDFPLEWHNGSENIFFSRPASDGAVDVYDLNLITGQSKLWSHFSPPDKTALLSLRHPIITSDGAHSIYIAQRIYSTLFVARNIK